MVITVGELIESRENVFIWGFHLVLISVESLLIELQVHVAIC